MENMEPKQSAENNSKSSQSPLSTSNQDIDYISPFEMIFSQQRLKETLPAIN
jgi:hypothetical protein